ncbi:hypothetical protein EFP84_18880 [Leptospira kmetyi]|uniref:RelA/SpoT domain-containing protein n=1 Tax=Leptospira kmetyi TaxID=408139 RepID=A0AAD0UU18_9LEPT|nr:hypothetical protein [Leptospira kmetyi]AYV57705.1 hypothetical protein EFP84_18880 [Leptospira kmetyi]
MKSEDQIKKEYSERFHVLVEIAARIEEDLREKIKRPRVDRISARAKSQERYAKKALKNANGKRKYSDPIKQIQDQVGARIVLFYLDDVEEVAQKIKEYYRHIEKQEIISDNPKEFGYVGLHFILFIPDELITKEEKPYAPTFFELQIKTLFQHAWSEAEHDLLYKPISEFTHDEQRKVAFTAAQAWGADLIFNELFIEKVKNANN